MEFIASSKSSSVSSSKGLTLKMPVLFTSTSTPPKRWVAAATNALAVSRLLASPAKSSTLSPEGSSSSLAASRTSCLRLFRTTPVAPSWRNRVAKGEHQTRPGGRRLCAGRSRSEEHTSELQSRQYLVCRLLLEKK